MKFLEQFAKYFQTSENNPVFFILDNGMGIIILAYSLNENLVINELLNPELESPSILELHTKFPQNIPDFAYRNSNTTKSFVLFGGNTRLQQISSGHITSTEGFYGQAIISVPPQKSLKSMASPSNQNELDIVLL